MKRRNANIPDLPTSRSKPISKWNRRDWACHFPSGGGSRRKRGTNRLAEFRRHSEMIVSLLFCIALIFGVVWWFAGEIADSNYVHTDDHPLGETYRTRKMTEEEQFDERMFITIPVTIFFSVVAWGVIQEQQGWW